MKLQPNLEGCMYLKFSYDGLKLAVSTGKNINIYSVPGYKLLKQLIGHQGMFNVIITLYEYMGIST